MSTSWKAVPADSGAKGFDSLAPVTEGILQEAWDDGCRFVVRYVHATSAAELDLITTTGPGGRGAMAFMLCTYANNWSGADAHYTAVKLGYPSGATLWLDVESVTIVVEDLIVKINTWASGARPTFDPGIYLGCQQLMTWQQQTQLACDRYWCSCSLVRDLFGNPAEPASSWNMIQLKPGNQHKYGTLVDLDIIEADTRGRTPVWAVAT